MFWLLGNPQFRIPHPESPPGGIRRSVPPLKVSERHSRCAARLTQFHEFYEAGSSCTERAAQLDLSSLC
jgi:hypothetical protein